MPNTTAAVTPKIGPVIPPELVREEKRIFQRAKKAKASK